VNQQIRIRFRLAADAGDQRDGFYVDDIRIHGYQTSNPTDVGESVVPKFFALHQNYPNPFNPTTEIRYQIAEVSHVALRVLDVLGREVATLVDEVQGSGGAERHGAKGAQLKSVTFDASNLSSGVYYYRLTAGAFSATRKLLLMK
jgi:hypothetical protein